MAVRNAAAREGPQNASVPVPHAYRQARQRKAKPKHSPGNPYTPRTYRQAIVRACRKADAEAHKAQPEVTTEMVLVPEWHPNQLRHNAATNLRKEYGVELARIILGHATAFTTEIYAEADQQQAIKVIEKIG